MLFPLPFGDFVPIPVLFAKLVLSSQRTPGVPVYHEVTMRFEGCPSFAVFCGAGRMDVFFGWLVDGFIVFVDSFSFPLHVPDRSTMAGTEASPMSRT